jgi:hypothetical protein
MFRELARNLQGERDDKSLAPGERIPDAAVDCGRDVGTLRLQLQSGQAAAVEAHFLADNARLLSLN